MPGTILDTLLSYIIESPNNLKPYTLGILFIPAKSLESFKGERHLNR